MSAECSSIRWRPAGPADQAGVHPGDIITAANGKTVDDANALRNQFAGKAPGTEVTLTILRENHEQQFHAWLAELPVEREAAASSGGSDSRREQLGIKVELLTAEQAARLGLRHETEGVVVDDVDPSGPAADAGIQPEDVILEVNHQPVKSAAELRAALLRSNSRPALLLVSRGGRN